MDDREAVAAIVAGDPAGLADAYDRYAASLYGYCRSLLHEPADAADAVQDTFVIAAARLGALRDPRKLRPWLYAVARNECHRKLRSKEAPAEIDDVADVTVGEMGDSVQRAELRELVRAAISGLNPPDREVIELNLRQELDGADLAAVLGVSRSHAHAMASRARGQLEKSLGALLVARTGRRACPALDTILADWDGRLTILLRKRVSRHIDQCDVCDEHKRRALRPAMLFGLAPLPLLPVELRHQTLRLCADDSPDAMDFKRHVVKQSGPLGPGGFPRPQRRSGRRLSEPGSALVAAASVAAAAIVIIAMIALRGSTPLHTLDAKAGNGPSSSAASANGTGVPASSAGAPSPSTGKSTNAAEVHPPQASAQPSSRPPSSLASSPAKRSSSPKPSKSPRPSRSPSPSPSPTPSPTVSPTPSPSPSPSPSPTTPSPPPSTMSPPPTTAPPPDR